MKAKAPITCQAGYIARAAERAEAYKAKAEARKNCIFNRISADKNRHAGSVSDSGIAQRQDKAPWIPFGARSA